MGSNGNGRSVGISSHLTNVQLSDEEISSILRNRAAVLAQVPGTATDTDSIDQFVTYRLGKERYGIDVKFVEEIQPLRDLTLIPCTPEFIIGAVNIRGSILPVIDVKKFFNMPEAKITTANKVIVIRIEDIQLGILADSVNEVVEVAAAAIEPQLATLSGVHEEFIRGVATGDLIVLDIVALAQDKRLTIHEEA